MRLWHLVTLAALAAVRDSAAQTVSGMVQAIPIVTRADPTATRSALTEGYVTQPAAMVHAMWKPFEAVTTINLEGLTLERGELTTGGYGEGYVDRRHPHAYVHELLAGVAGARSGVSASLFAGRGFAPFGSDDPMVRPFEKYPVNHHLAQVLERVVAVAAVRAGTVIGEFGVFNGDEPTSPGSSPNFDRFGDSWATRITLLPAAGAELSGSIARVTSPEVRVGHGLDQHKASVVARVTRMTSERWRYAMVEWERTDEMTRGTTTTRLASVLGEAAYCRSGAIVAARIERTDRPEEEPLADPFRTPRPSTDLSNLGVSRWTTLTFSLSSPPFRTRLVSGRPFVEVARVHAGAGSPPGIFDPELRYGSSGMWMLTAGVRLRAGMMHDRMGRYGAAVPATHMGTGGHAAESDTMAAMPMAGASPMKQSSTMSESLCAM
jgi:hypothetical protein